MGMLKKMVSCNTISFWLWSLISFAHSSALEENCWSLGVRANEVRKVAVSLLFKRNCVVHWVLKAGTWSAHAVYLALLLPERCLPQALGYILHWACGGGSAGRVTR